MTDIWVNAVFWIKGEGAMNYQQHFIGKLMVISVQVI